MNISTLPNLSLHAKSASVLSVTQEKKENILSLVGENHPLCDANNSLRVPTNLTFLKRFSFLPRATIDLCTLGNNPTECSKQRPYYSKDVVSHELFVHVF